MLFPGSGFSFDPLTFNEPKEESKINAKPEEPKEADLSDWRTWSHKRAGECACGIHRDDCTYHK